MKFIKHIFNKHGPIALSILGVLAFVVIMRVFAATPYAPGTSLDPAEGPGDAFVSIPTADWTTVSNDMHNTNSGNVGIGTASPTNALHVVGSIYATTQLATPRVINPTNGAISLYLNSTGLVATSDNDLGSAVLRAESSNVPVLFDANDSAGGGGVRFQINRDGNVGIGTTTPTATLFVKSAGFDGSGTILNLKNSTDVNILEIGDSGRVGINIAPEFGKTVTLPQGATIFFKDISISAPSTIETDVAQGIAVVNTNGGFLQATSNSTIADISGFNFTDLRIIGDGIGTAGNGIYLKARSSAADWRTGLKYLNSGIGEPDLLLVPDGFGNVGIGAVPDAARLHVKGLDDTASTYALKIESATTQYFSVRDDGTIFVFGSPNFYNGINMSSPTQPTLDIDNTGAGGKRVQIFTDTNGIRFNDVTGSSSFVFGRNAGATTDFIIDGTGNVGIGALSPTNILEVGDGTGQRNVMISGGDSANEGASIRFKAGGLNDLSIGHYSAIHGGPFDNTMTFHNGSSHILMASGGNNVGIGHNGAFSSWTPARPLHIRDVMRLEPIDTAPLSPSDGDIYFDADNDDICIRGGGAWHDTTGAACS